MKFQHIVLFKFQFSQTESSETFLNKPNKLFKHKINQTSYSSIGCLNSGMLDTLYPL